MAEVKQFKMASKRTGRVVFGLLSGLSNTFGFDVNIARFALVLLVLFFGVGIPAYILGSLIGWLLFGYDD